MDVRSVDDAGRRPTDDGDAARACAPARPAAAEIELAPILTSPPPAGGSGHMRIAFRARLLAASKLPHGSVAFNSSGLHAGDERDARARAASLGLLALSRSPRFSSAAAGVGADAVRHRSLCTLCRRRVHRQIQIDQVPSSSPSLCQQAGTR
jgi:hypothetical protein